MNDLNVFAHKPKLLSVHNDGKCSISFCFESAIVSSGPLGKFSDKSVVPAVSLETW